MTQVSGSGRVRVRIKVLDSGRVEPAYLQTRPVLHLAPPRLQIIIGGSGYLGQYLLQSFSDSSPHLSTALTHHSSSPP
ncbi:hypothetical protein HanIR_Chr16g0824691 [Helianthus annuus]|nr:hypothetical protein HanIR_Chr16g0824691 [Helianthus annuus]